MSSYRVDISSPAARQLRKLPSRVQAALKPTIFALAEDPRPPGCKKLAGPGDLYRVRVGDWRIVYTVEDARLVVLVVRVGHRGDVYRGR